MANISASNDVSTPFSESINGPRDATTSESFVDATEWTSQEQTILEDLLVRYSSDSKITKYAKIAKNLNQKSIRDVAMRCTMLKLDLQKNNGKRRKENTKSLPNSMVVDEITSDLHTQNEYILQEISRNLASYKLKDNIALFSKSHEILMKLVKKVDGDNISVKSMMSMPPLPVKLKELPPDAIFLPSTPVKQEPPDEISNHNFSKAVKQEF